MFLDARHLFSHSIVPFFLFYHLPKKKKTKKKAVSSNFSNMKAYVVVRGSVANIRSIADEKGPEIIYFQCSK